ncbi:hypothetical protein DIPPA_01827 [Diplonema papillatum]|nr:hypothetical protein DIPPA_01827 [Diplonema papillatum]
MLNRLHQPFGEAPRSSLPRVFTRYIHCARAISSAHCMACITMVPSNRNFTIQLSSYRSSDASLKASAASTLRAIGSARRTKQMTRAVASLRRSPVAMRLGPPAFRRWSIRSRGTARTTYGCRSSSEKATTSRDATARRRRASCADSRSAANAEPTACHANHSSASRMASSASLDRKTQVRAAWLRGSTAVCRGPRRSGQRSPRKTLEHFSCARFHSSSTARRPAASAGMRQSTS